MRQSAVESRGDAEKSGPYSLISKHRAGDGGYISVLHLGYTMRAPAYPCQPSDAWAGCDNS